ncbi:carbohydrate kinase family protein [Paenibacillus sp. Soil522]|uniref:carbohydrate kinase family protein n=1 Tax=Paenibacillus sp. Soil522 TaxID=1736388 RepID=UPI000700DE1A|nr:carbohydrate kinase family protein [Paenibacillus sp. Soil522]KRE46638.1 hypothetical protein ASG81_11335 [Paenibacillus sp. Soil522]
MLHSTANQADFVIAGNINLDIIPTLTGLTDCADDLASAFIPGRLIEIGPSITTTGGCVSNTGLALSRLGFSTHLVGKIAEDHFGQILRNLIEDQASPSTVIDLIVSPSGSSSYTIVMSAPGYDRFFLHSPGVNANFSEHDIPYEALPHTKLFHFGYPPVMQPMYANEGAELQSIFRRVKLAGAITSLDMARPDPQSTAGKANWRTILTGLLPYVDIFLPSFEEILYMLRRNHYDELEQRFGRAHVDKGINADLLHDLTDELLQMGCLVAGIKLGDKGFYLRTSDQRGKWDLTASNLNVNPIDWTGRELLAPCYQVDIAGTTGSGDCTIAGFLAGLFKGQSPEQAVTSAVAVGAYCVEHTDATSGIPSWETVQDRISKPWKRLTANYFETTGWYWESAHSVWLSALDNGRRNK